MGLQGGCQPGKLARLPDVVLVRQGDEVAGAQRDRPLEVLGEAEVRLVAVQPDGKRCLGNEGLEQPHRTVGGPVVAGHELIGEPGLRDDAVELLPQERRPVVGAQCDGHGGGCHGHQAYRGPGNRPPRHVPELL